MKEGATIGFKGLIGVMERIESNFWTSGYTSGLVKLSEALSIINSTRHSTEAAIVVGLACSFTPLHLETFLAAQLQKELHARRVSTTVGLYGNLTVNLQRMLASTGDETPEMVAVVVEWGDLDPRLAYRSLGGWTKRSLSGLEEAVNQKLAELRELLLQLAKKASIAVCLPTLGFPPVESQLPSRASGTVLALRAELAAFALDLELSNGKEGRLELSVVHPEEVDRCCPNVKQRLDLKSEYSTGFPYTIAHAAEMGRILAQNLLQEIIAPKKGLITDLDDTVWKGIVGEVGVENIVWSQENHAHIHGQYQQLLESLAENGTLLAIASKNDLNNVLNAWRNRPDLLVGMDRFFPVEANWQAKSSSVGRILKSWNILPDGVVFIDDSPMEVAEVKAAFPEMECYLFPKENPGEAWELFFQLRAHFGRARASDEDRLRLRTLRQGGEFQCLAESAGDQESFLKSLESVITVRWEEGTLDHPRLLELVNKTNQFNLNGKRYTPREWQIQSGSPEAFTLSVSYRDRFGPLGVIAVLRGRYEDLPQHLHITSWVMSCRAFSRRIEYASLTWVFEHFGLGELTIDYVSTEKNGPFREWLSSVGVPQEDLAHAGPVKLRYSHCGGKVAILGRVDSIVPQGRLHAR